MRFQTLYILASMVLYVSCKIGEANLWFLSRLLIVDPNRVCSKVNRLRSRQVNICRREPMIISQIINGSMESVRECQYQFADRKWNCPTKNKRSMRKLLSKDTRETGFVHAMTSAAIVHKIATGCAQGSILDCYCDVKAKHFKTFHSNFLFAENYCNNYISYAYRKSKEFLDENLWKKRNDFKNQILLHNYEAGRLSVKNYLEHKCKCHGMSGSCTTKTCWRQLPNLRSVSNRLKSKFDLAIQVIADNTGKRFLPEDNGARWPNQEDIVYSETSPNFCTADRLTGSLGTRGRECTNSTGTGGCDMLCCGRGFRTIMKTENCRCKFNWCCNVVCEKCRRPVQVCL
ncbi:Frizzled-8 [Sarcoptes scabiei]|nr:Frizzled-8 [Sarcoptes scabiei]